VSESFAPIDRIKELLTFVQDFKWQKRFKKTGFKRSNDTPFEQILSFRHAVLSGALPDAETLACIAFSFDRYISKHGELSLDEAFKLRSKPKAGNPSAQYSRGNEINSLLFNMACLRANDKSISIEKAAGMVAPDEVVNTGNLERQYTEKQFSRIEEILRGE